MIQTVFSPPSIYNNYAGAHPFTNGFAFDAFSNHSRKTRQKIPEFSNFKGHIISLCFHFSLKEKKPFKSEENLFSKHQFKQKGHMAEKETFKPRGKQ